MSLAKVIACGILLAPVTFDVKRESCDLPPSTSYCQYACYKDEAICEYYHPVGSKAERTAAAINARWLHFLDHPDHFNTKECEDGVKIPYSETCEEDRTEAQEGQILFHTRYKQAKGRIQGRTRHDQPNAD